MKRPFFKRHLKKETTFFPVLKEMSGVMLVASDLMVEFIKNYDHATAPGYFKRIKEEEKKGDVLSNLIFEELNKTFITPFDREDINRLASYMDDVTDSINSCAKRLVLYNPKKVPDQAVELANLIHDGAVCIGKAVDELEILKRTAKKINTYCDELHDIENKADDVYEHFVQDLFEQEADGIELVKIKEIVNELEKTTDVEENVGKIIKTIMVKYA